MSEGYANSSGGLVSNSGSKNVSNNTNTLLTSIDLSAGEYIIEAYARFEDSSATGIRLLSLKIGTETDILGSLPGIADNWKHLRSSIIKNFTESKTVELMATQTSGTTFQITYSIKAIRI